MIRYRRVTPQDLPVLRTLLQSLANTDGGGPVASVDCLRRHGFGATPLFAALLAERQGEALGMVIYFPEFSTHRGEPGLFVQDLYVVNAARGLGLGRGLLAAAMAAQDWGARFISLGVAPDNTLAQRFYAKLGFRKRGYEFLILDGTELESLR